MLPKGKLAGLANYLSATRWTRRWSGQEISRSKKHRSYATECR